MSLEWQYECETSVSSPGAEPSSDKFTNWRSMVALFTLNTLLLIDKPTQQEHTIVHGRFTWYLYFLSVMKRRKDTVVNFKCRKCDRILSYCHMTQLRHILSIHVPAWPIRCDRRRAWPWQEEGLTLIMCLTGSIKYDRTHVPDLFCL